MPDADPFSALIEAMHAYIDNGGDGQTMIETAAMVADERQDADAEEEQ